MKMGKALSGMNNKQDDQRSKLLYAIKPYLSEHRRGKVDNAANILRMVGMMDLFKDGFHF